MDEKKKLVTVSKSVEALSEPQFLIKHGEKIYLTLAVLEYDPKQARTREQKEGVALMESYFQKEEGGSGIQVRSYRARNGGGQATDPDEN